MRLMARVFGRTGCCPLGAGGADRLECTVELVDRHRVVIRRQFFARPNSLCIVVARPRKRCSWRTYAGWRLRVPSGARFCWLAGLLFRVCRVRRDHSLMRGIRLSYFGQMPLVQVRVSSWAFQSGCELSFVVQALRIWDVFKALHGREGVDIGHTCPLWGAVFYC